METPRSDITPQAARRLIVGRARRPVFSALAAVLGTVCVTVIAGFLIGLVLFALGIQMDEHPPARHSDGIVALTGGSDRVADAVELLAQGHADRLLITGVNSATTRGDLARRVPGAAPWVACCIDLGYRAADTVGNAQETADWVRAKGLHSLIVVTSNYHMPRALAEMAFELPGIDLQPYAVVPERIRPTTWDGTVQFTRLVFGEYVKYLAVRTRQAFQTGAGSAADFHVAVDRGP